MTITLTDSVGIGGANVASDVIKIQERLLELGFEFVGAPPDGIVGNNTIRGIRLFQSIKNGSDVLGGDGRVDVNGDTHKWLNASNAPHWQIMTGSGAGFRNIEVEVETWDNHDFGTNWLDSTLIAAGQKYETDYRSSNTSSLLTVNDASRRKGGNTPHHSGHETGLMCDLRLPQINNTDSTPGNRTYNSPDYDQEATRAILLALRAQPLADSQNIFFNDPILINEGLCRYSSDHDDHIHFQIEPPARDERCGNPRTIGFSAWWSCIISGMFSPQRLVRQIRHQLLSRS